MGKEKRAQEPDDADGEETLAGASAKGLNVFLAGKRSRVTHSALPPPRVEAAAGACGAPAVARAQAETDGGREGAAAAEAHPYEQEAEEEWEDVQPAVARVDEEEEEEAEEEAFEVELEAPEPAGKRKKQEVTKKPTKPRKEAVRRATAVDRLYAEAVHRTHLLCLATRALAFDMAADESVLGAQVFSMLPARRLEAVPRGGQDELASLSDTFGKAFMLMAPAQQGRGGAASAKGARGPPLVSRPSAAERERLRLLDQQSLASVAATALRGAMSRRNGSDEELSALFVALCRARGLAARTAHALFPVARKPDAESLRLSALLPMPWRMDAQNWRYAEVQCVSQMEAHGQMLAQRRRQQGRPQAQAGAAAAARATAPRAAAAPPAQGGAAEEVAIIDLTASDGEDAPPLSARDTELARDLARAAAESKRPSAPAPPPVCRPPAAGGASESWSRASGAVLHWVEVYITDGGGSDGVSTGRWVSLHPWERGAGRFSEHGCNAAAAAEAAVGGSKTPLVYVLGCSGGGARDVTQRYSKAWSLSQPLRCDAEWWASALAPLESLEAAATAAAATTPGKSSAQVAAELAAKEAAELEEAALNEPLPSTIAALKGHPLYVLERHLSRYEGIHPRKVLGLVGREQEPVFARSCVQDLHTADVWRSDYGRSVRTEELDTPAKRVAKRGVVKAQRDAAKAAKAARRAAASDGEEEAEDEEDEEPLPDWLGIAVAPIRDTETGDDEMPPAKRKRQSAAAAAAATVDALAPNLQTVLYGEWQTEPWVQEGAEGGKVPRNAYNNVDLNRKPVPPGCVHLSAADYPRIGAAARSLGIDAPAAMVGFESHGGRNTPVLDGVVVVQDSVRELIKGYKRIEAEKEEKQAAKRRKAALSLWRRLVNTWHTRARLQAEQEGGAAGGAAEEDDVVIISDDEPAPRARGGAGGGMQLDREEM